MLLVVVVGLGMCAVVAVALVLVLRVGKRRPGAGDGAASGDGADSSSLPAPSDLDDRCVTYMSSDEDSGECFALVYNACADGRKDVSNIPRAVAQHKDRALAQVYEAQKENFDGPPRDWAAVCVARPDKAGKGACGHVTKGEFRVWAHGKAPKGSQPCDRSGNMYLKAHFDGDGAIQGNHTGTVGHI